jgi:protein-S-isoprenylcysteine O-methyltransferase Ste14
MAATFGISAFHRYRARRIAGSIPRKREGLQMGLARAAVAIPLYASILAFLVQPRWLAWSELDVPHWLRWIGAALGAFAVPMAAWVFRALGKNVSETVLTRTDHELVTTGPYRWVRHPLYLTGAMLLLGVGLMAANWFILLFALIAMAATLLFVVPIEEARLIERFGSRYVEYRRGTGRMVPRLLRRG